MALSVYRSACKETTKQALPLLASRSIAMALNMWSAILFSQSGQNSSENHNEVIAYGPITVVMMLFSQTNISQTPLISLMSGHAQDIPFVGRYLRPVMIMTALTTLILSPPAAFTGRAFEAMGHGSDVRKIIDDYMQSFLSIGGLFPFLMQGVLNRLFIATNKNKAASYLTLGSAVLSAGSSYLACHEGQGDTRYFGYGYAVSQWLSLVGGLGYLLYEGWGRDLFKTTDWFDSEKYCILLKKGVPMTLTPLVESAVFSGLFGIIGRQGPEAAAVLSAANQGALIVISLLWVLGRITNKQVTFLLKNDQQEVKLKSQLYAGITLGETCLALPFLGMTLAAPTALMHLFGCQVIDAGVSRGISSVMAAGIVVAEAPRITGMMTSRSIQRNAQSLKINLPFLILGLALASVSMAFGAGPATMLSFFYGMLAVASVLQVRDVYKHLSSQYVDELTPLQHLAISSPDLEKQPDCSS